jgi:poly-gamma-glutamate synthesis protein (capsule biosynthesis protein)
MLIKMKKIILFFLFTLLASGILYYVIISQMIHVSMVGDILLDRGIRKTIEQKGADYPYQKIKSLFAKSDIVLGNLECPITNVTNSVIKEKKFIFKADVNNISALKLAGFNLLNLANNHSMDQGRTGLLDNIQNLHSADIQTVGAGTNRDDAHKPVIITKKGIKIGFLGYSVFPSEGYFYLKEAPDVAHINENLQKEVQDAKKKCDFLIVSFHWGQEFHFFPTQYQIEDAHKAIESGADMIVGHHPHVLQGVEKYKGKYIFYSLGNFVFDRQKPERTDETMILNFDIKNKKSANISLIPIEIVDCQPQVMTNKASEEWLKQMKLYSKNMNVDFEIKKDKIFVK